MKISPLRDADAAAIAKIAGHVSGKHLIRRKSVSTPLTTRAKSQRLEDK
ncbi:MAG: hypothetical protein ACREC1_05210 [Methylovirgula sp.]